MMPVVRGVADTKAQMLLYTLMLLPLTIMPSVFGITGAVLWRGGALLGAALPAATADHRSARTG